MYRQCFYHSMYNLDSNYSPDSICKICYNMMDQHLKNQKSLSLVKRARQRDPRNHPKECFIFNTSTSGANQGKRQGLDYKYNYSCIALIFKKDTIDDLSPANTSSAIDPRVPSLPSAEVSSSTAEQPGPSSASPVFSQFSP